MADTSTGGDRDDTVWRLLLVDGRPLILHGIRAVVAGRDDMAVVGSTTSLEDARTLLAERSCDIVVVALELPDGSGLDLLDLVHRAGHRVRTLLLADRLTARLRTDAEARGVGHVLSTRTTAGVLLDAIGRLAAGTDDERSRAAAALDSLTPRQLEIALLVERGRSNGEIAWALKVSPKTVETHLTAIYGRCDVQGRIGLLHLVQRSGLPVRPPHAARGSDAM